MDTNTILMIFLILLLVIMLFKSYASPVPHPVPVPVPVPVPSPIKPIGGCAGTRYGCCPNGVTSRMNAIGTNCYTL
jgi:hypothetical protein